MKKYIEDSPVVVINNQSLKDYSFKESNLYKARIINTKFYDCDFRNSNLSQARLTNCEFKNCNFNYAAMTGITIEGCSFDECTTEHSNLCWSKISNSDFCRCILRGLHLYIDWVDNRFDSDTLVKACRGDCVFTKEDLLELFSPLDELRNKIVDI